MNILKIGIAGYGIVGKKRHIFIDENINAKVVAICDQNFKEDSVLEKCCPRNSYRKGLFSTMLALKKAFEGNNVVFLVHC